ncbi:ATP-binding cassette sub-family G member 1-like [Odontomachus brunneus]|uniref:ATP-binding cassette sub-family G member 1-like n=1 Tax=Odontomachus brunneus TaxID=486640 RepID=UPI0013F1EB20|nr:ATP-binding cassette sub-family G member 1-like [Odontomachus brunneus]XP_032665794.1 ATP-binding cassette sub-family G member 1-like [Odontomachus brunneus]
MISSSVSDMDSDNKNAVTTEALDDVCSIHLGDTERLMELKGTRTQQLYIEFKDLCYSVRYHNKENKKRILCNVTGHFDPGKVTVIIGPSGAGKTTLLKIISGEKFSNVEGTVTVNGIEQNRGSFRKHVCYVPQQFALLPFLTIKETLYVAARLKLGTSQSNKTILAIVNMIARNLGLLNCVDVMANKLSGGERKRLSIGLEMITKPAVLLLDEPTSGLDSVASNQIINILHDMAKANCTVVCAIHQPSSQMISQFDDILVLNHGKCMYCGSKDEILNTFDNAGFACPRFYNIAEFVLEVITEQRDGNLHNLYETYRNECEKTRLDNNCSNYDTNLLTASEYNLKKDDSLVLTNNIKQTSTWQQQKILFLRGLICIKRDSFLTKLRFAVHILVGLLLGVVFYDFGHDAEKVNSNIASLFFFLLFLFFSSTMPAVQMFPTEAAVFLQEHLNNWYHLRSYYSVKILTDLPMQILCSSCFTIISYYLTGQPMEFHRILQVWSICVLITIIGQTYGVLAGAVFNTELGIFLIPASNIPLLLFAGFFLKLGEISKYLQPLGYISFYRYAFEGLIQAVYSDRTNLSCSTIYCYLQSPNTIMEMMDMPTMSFYSILIILGFWIFCLHVLIYVTLYIKIYYARN